MINKIKISLQDWTRFEKAWLILFTGLTIYFYFAFEDTLIGLISSISGMLCVVLVAKGKITNYAFGIIQTSTYTYIAFGYELYGEAMLNGLFYLPIQFLGIYMWMKYRKSKESSKQGEDIFVKRLTKKGWIIVVATFVMGAVVYAQILIAINAQQVRIDSMAVVLSVIAQVLMVQRYAEQWVIWIVVNVLTITLWVITMLQDGGSDWNMVVMWSAFLVNSIYGYVNWIKLSKTQNGENIT